MKKILIYITLFISVTALGLFIGGRMTASEKKVEAEVSVNKYSELDDVTFEKGRVIDITIKEKTEDELKYGMDDIVQLTVVELLSGDKKGEIVRPEANYLEGSEYYDINFEKGDKVILRIETTSEGEAKYYISSEVRESYIWILIIVFVIVLLLVGKKQGFKTIITLLITVFFIFFVELPLLLQGKHAVMVTMLVAFLITINTVTIISGLTKKGLAAILGTLFGVVIAGSISMIISSRVELIGLSYTEYMNLVTVQGIEFNFQHLLFSAILLGTLGAVMDVAMSIASSIDALHSVNATLTKNELFKAGMGVGRDIMGTMANTLILAYTGSMLPLLLGFMAHEFNLTKLINFDVIATEIIRSVAGSIGLVLTIPFTALIMVMFIKDEKFNTPKENKVE